MEGANEPCALASFGGPAPMNRHRQMSKQTGPVSAALLSGPVFLPLRFGVAGVKGEHVPGSEGLAHLSLVVADTPVAAM